MNLNGISVSIERARDVVHNPSISSVYSLVSKLDRQDSAAESILLDYFRHHLPEVQFSFLMSLLFAQPKKEDLPSKIVAKSFEFVPVLFLEEKIEIQRTPVTEFQFSLLDEDQKTRSQKAVQKTHSQAQSWIRVLNQIQNEFTYFLPTNV